MNEKQENESGLKDETKVKYPFSTSFLNEKIRKSSYS